MPLERYHVVACPKPGWKVRTSGQYPNRKKAILHKNYQWSSKS